MEHLTAFILAGFALAGSPGPATLSLAATGAAFGARRGLGYMVGLIVGLVGVMILVATGAVGLLMAVPGARPVVIVAVSAYFIYLAWRIATAPALDASSGDGERPSFLAGLALSLVNPKGYAAMAALFSGFALVAGDVVRDAAVKTAVLVVIATLVNLAWLFAGAGLTRFFHDPRTSRIINIGFAILLVVSVALAFIV